MSAKKSASNIRHQDREEFNTKLQALHKEMAAWKHRHAWHYNLGEASWFSIPVESQCRVGPRLKKELITRSVLLNGTKTWRLEHDPDSTQTIIIWDWENRRRWEQVWGPGARKMIQNHYTDGQDRAICEIIA